MFSQTLSHRSPSTYYGPDLKKFSMDVNKFDGLVKCKVLPPRGLYIPSRIYIYINKVDVGIVQKVCRN